MSHSQLSTQSPRRRARAGAPAAGRLIALLTALTSACSSPSATAPATGASGSASTAVSARPAVSAKTAVPASSAAPASAGAPVSQDWLDQVSRRIRAGQYAVREGQRTGVLEAHNLAHAMRVRFQSATVRVAFDRANHVSAEPPSEHSVGQRLVQEATDESATNPAELASGRELSVQTVALARGEQRVRATRPSFALGRCRADGAVDERGECLKRAELVEQGWVEWWENRPEGLEQGWDVPAPPFAGDRSAPLRVELRVRDASVELDADGQGATFEIARGERVRYDSLAAYDADGKALPIQLIARAGGLAIEVDERGARYPIAIDPMYSSASWVAEGGQDAARFGTSVAAAGDVNGDGYGDVIVGAYLSELGQTDEGFAYIYHGSATGLGVSPVRTLQSDQANAWFGYSVASAGDVNNDGYADVIIGAPHASFPESNEGRAYIYHGSSTGIGASAARTLETNQAGANFGISVASAGLLNNDLYGDVVVGAIGYTNTQSAEGAAYLFHGSSSGIPTSWVRILEPDVANAAFGWSVASAGDINGDGFGDLVVGAINYTNGESGEGAAFVYMGTSTGIASNTPAKTLEGAQVGSARGCAVAGSGDNNGDGYADIVVGSYNFDTSGTTNAGRITWYKGSATGLVTSGLIQSQSYEQTSAGTGFSVAAAGDVNGDGLADIAFGTWAMDNGSVADAGRVTVHFGHPDGLLGNVGADWIKNGSQSLAYLGSVVASAGDVNGDGYSDLIVGEPRYDNGNTDEGRALLYYGSRGILSSASQGSLSTTGFVNAAGDVNGDGYADVIVADHTFNGGLAAEGKVAVFHGGPTGIATSASFSVEGNQANARLGQWAATAGDVDSDGYADIAIAVPNWDGGQTDEGKVLVYRGGASGISSGQTPWAVESNIADAQWGQAVQAVGDVNGDGYGDIGFRGNESDTIVRVFHGGASGLGSSDSWNQAVCSTCSPTWGEFSTAGDVNGDGFDDLIVSDQGYESFMAPAFFEGKLFVYHGSAGGLASSASWSLESNLTNEFLGLSVASAGDVNGDGYGDVIVGAQGADAKGRAYVYLGGASGLNTVPAWQTSSIVGSDYGALVGGAGDLNGDGYGDVFATAYTYSNTLSNQGMIAVYLGSSGGLGTAAWAKLGSAANTLCGVRMKKLGDVNGDGYSDLSLLCGSTYDTYFGNGSDRTIGYALRPQAQRTGGTPIQPGGRTGSTGGFHAVMKAARGPMGRARVKLQIETKVFGFAFSGNPSDTSSSWVDVGAAGASLSLPISSSAGSAPHYRMRLLYHPSSAPWAQRSRWIYGGNQGVSRGVHARLLN